MALISRVQFSNFLDSTRSPGWKPDYVGETLDFGAQSAAIIMDNGTGKTSIVDSLLWVLSMDLVFRGKVLPKLAPESSGYYTHVRIEFVLPSDVGATRSLLVEMGVPVDGEHHVVGAFANRETAKSDSAVKAVFYKYKGRFEDVPVHVERELDGYSSREMLADSEFEAALKRVGGARVAKRGDWHEVVGDFIPSEQVVQMTEYQKRGGGDKSASFHDVKPRKGETFDRAFFRQCVAPEILKRIIASDDSDGGRDGSFERGAVSQADGVIKAKVSVERKRAEVDRMRAAELDLRRMEEAAGEVLSAELRLNEAKSRHAANAARARVLLSSESIPGFPVSREVLARIPKSDASILENILYEARGEVFVKTRLLSERSIPFSSIGTGRKLFSYLPAADRGAEAPGSFLAIAMEDLEARARAPGEDPVAREKLELLLDDVRRVLKDRSGHPLRLNLEERRRSVGEEKMRDATLEKSIAELRKEQVALLKRIGERNEDRAALARIKESGLFGRDEIESIEELPSRLEAELGAANEAIAEHERRLGELTSAHDDYEAASRECGPNGISSALEGLRAAELDADEALRSARDSKAESMAALDGARREAEVAETAERNARNEARRLELEAGALDVFEEEFGVGVDPGAEALRIEGERRSADDEATALKGALSSVRAEARVAEDSARKAQSEAERVGVEFSRVNSLRSRFLDFEAAFPGRNAIGFISEAEREREAATKESAVLESELAGSRALLLAEEEFAAFSSASPAAWLADASAERERLALEKSVLLRKLEDAGRMLEALGRDGGAPTETERNAAVLLQEAGLSFVPFHERVRASGSSEERIRSILAQASALLFSPVFDVVEDAERAARLLGEADASVPVWLASDLDAWLAGGAPAARSRGELHHGLMAGVSTRRLEVLLDPDLVPREIAKWTRLGEEATSALVEVERRSTELLPEGRACALARKAAESIAVGARSHVEALVESLRRSNERFVIAVEMLSAASRAMASAAAEYSTLGGDGAFDRLAAELEACACVNSEASAFVDVVAERLFEAEVALERHEEKRRLIAEGYHWADGARKAQAFVDSGGRAALAKARRIEVSARDALERARERARVLEASAKASEARFSDASTTSEAAKLAVAARGPRLAAALRHERDGGLAFVLGAGGRRGLLDLALAAANDRSAFSGDCRRAARFLATGEAVEDGPEERLAKLVRLIENSESEKRELGELLPRAVAELDSLRRLCSEVERNLLVAYDEASKLRGLGDDGDVAIDAAAEVAANAFAMELRKRGARMSAAAAALFKESAPVSSVDGLSVDEEESADLSLPGEVGWLSGEALGFGLGAIGADLSRLRKEVAAATAAYAKAHGNWGRSAHFDSVLHAAVARALDSPASMRGILTRHTESIRREEETWEAAKAREEESRSRLKDILVGLAMTAADNLDLMKREARPDKGGAGFLVEAEMAGESDVERLIDDIVDRVERRRRRFDEDCANASERDEEKLRDELAASVRDEIHDKMFRDARIRVVHPQMGAGHPFPLDRASVSGGQATALMLLWTIKLASYSVARAAAAASGAMRRRLRAASHSIVIVDGLFSDLSEPRLIRESMEAMRDVKGHFQLVGFIHSPYYRNDWEIFPTCLKGSKTSWSDGSGAEGCMVTIARERESGAGGVSIVGLRAASGLPSDRGGRSADDASASSTVADSSVGGAA